MFHRFSTSIIFSDKSSLNKNSLQRTFILISLRKEYGSIYQNIKIEHCITRSCNVLSNICYSKLFLFLLEKLDVTMIRDWMIKTKRFSFPHRIKISSSTCFISAFLTLVYSSGIVDHFLSSPPLRKWYFSQGRKYSSVLELGESSFSLSPASVVCTVAQSNGLHISRTRSSV